MKKFFLVIIFVALSQFILNEDSDISKVGIKDGYSFGACPGGKSKCWGFEKIKREIFTEEEIEIIMAEIVGE